MMNSKILYKLSIILNIFLILVSGSLLYHKRDRQDYQFISSSGGVIPSEQALSSFNNKPLQAIND
jgi:hypothetical protein